MIFASNLTVSTQVSDAGVNSKTPCQKLIRKGVTLSDLVAKCCFYHSTVVYDKVKVSLCLVTLFSKIEAN